MSVSSVTLYEKLYNRRYIRWWRKVSKKFISWLKLRFTGFSGWHPPSKATPERNRCNFLHIWQMAMRGLLLMAASRWNWVGRHNPQYEEWNQFLAIANSKCWVWEFQTLAMPSQSHKHFSRIKTAKQTMRTLSINQRQTQTDRTKEAYFMMKVKIY